MVEFVKKHQIVLLVTGIVLLAILLFRMTRHSAPQVLSKTETFSEAKYHESIMQLQMITDKQNPREAFVLLKRQLKENPPMVGSCHGITHEMGHMAYEKYQDFGKAMDYKQEICNAGYLHGVIESYFSEATDLSKQILTVCSPYYLGTYTRWQCDHGIGHGVMVATENNLPEALTLCEKLSDETSRQGCSNGVFMENAISDQENHPSRFKKASDLFYPCNEVEVRYKGHCYGYAPVLFLEKSPGKYEEALIWCETIETGYQLPCAQGVGSRLISENIENTDQVVRTCLLTVKQFADSCLTGVVYEYINHYGSLDPAKKLCTNFPDDKKILCNNLVAKKAPLFVE